MDELQASTYLSDLGFLIRDLAVEAIRERDESRTRADADLYAGRLSAFYDVVSLMLQQAVAFGIEREQLGVGDFDPNRDLL